jgi:hypothetical protein
MYLERDMKGVVEPHIFQSEFNIKTDMRVVEPAVPC